MTVFCSPVARRRLTAMLFGVLLLLPVRGLYAQSSTPTPSVTSKTATDNSQSTLSETDEYRLSPSVIKFAQELGMSPETGANVFTIFNLLILFIGVGYGLLKILPKTFRNRNTVIQKHLVDAHTATEEATARLSSVEERLSKLDGQIAAMRSQAEAESIRDEQRIKASVEEEKNKIVAAAEMEIQSVTALARREIQKYAAELAVEQAARKLVITPETDCLLVESFAHQLGEGSRN